MLRSRSSRLAVLPSTFLGMGLVFACTEETPFDVRVCLSLPVQYASGMSATGGVGFADFYGQGPALPSHHREGRLCLRGFTPSISTTTRMLVKSKAERIELFMLKELTTEERWTMGDTTLEGFLTKMFPNVEKTGDDLLGGRNHFWRIGRGNQGYAQAQDQDCHHGSATTLGERGKWSSVSVLGFGRCK